jgi:hypothetical protein
MSRFLFGTICIISLFSACNSDTNYSPSVNTDSFDYKYSKARFKTEGYSDKDSAIAAEAITKFYESQKNRSR